MNFFAELKRRYIYRVAVAYAVVAWILIQVVNNVSPALNLPTWAPTLIIVLLIVGFPIALIFAWTVDLKAATATATDSEITEIPSAGIGAAPPPSTLSAARAASAPRSGVVSIAVLPFANMSEDANQEFFSDGMSEEITTALANVSDLRVVARTSAFEFKGRSHNIRKSERRSAPVI